MSKLSFVSSAWNTQTSGAAVPSGALSSSNGFDDILRVPYIASEMSALNNGEAVFYKFLDALGTSEATDQPRFDFAETDRKPTQAKVSANAAEDASTIVITEASVPVGAVLYYLDASGALKDAMKVTAAAAGSGTTSSLTVTRKYFGASTAAAITAGTYLEIGLQELGEGDDYNVGTVTAPTSDYNYLSFWSTSAAITDVQDLSNMRFEIGKTRSQITDAYAQALAQMDGNLRNGVRNLRAASGTVGTIYTSGGFRDLCTNVVSAASIASMSALDALFLDTFGDTNSSNVKVMFCGTTVHNTLIAFQQAQGTTQYQSHIHPVIGAKVTRIDLPSGGSIDVVLDRHGFANRPLGYMLVDMAHIKARHYTGFEGISMRDVSGVGSHTNTTELYGSCGLELRLGDKVHAYGYIGS